MNTRNEIDYYIGVILRQKAENEIKRLELMKQIKEDNHPLRTMLKKVIDKLRIKINN